MTTRKQIHEPLETAFGIYQPEKVIGEGGTGRVYLATNADGENVALKILKRERVTSETKKRFKNEILFCEQDRHPNIIRVLDHGSHKTAPFYVMPLLVSAFRDLLTRANPEKRLLYLSQLLDGVEAAHLCGVIHRDLKPENVLFDPTHDRVVVADFGIAHFNSDELYTAVETTPERRLANFEYAAPEQRRRGQLIDCRADIYALGLMVNEAFTGHVPHGADFAKISAKHPDLAWIDSAVTSMIQQRPDERPDTIAAVKRLFLMNHQTYVQQQRLSEIQRRVIPEGEEDDPLALTPPKIVGVDWKNNSLTLILDKPLNLDWMQALYNMRSYAYSTNQPPGSFRLDGNKLLVGAPADEVQQVIDHVKVWLPHATNIYRTSRERHRIEVAQREQQKLDAERIELERRERLLKDIRL